MVQLLMRGPMINPDIGLDPKCVGDIIISEFTAANNTTSALVVTIEVTPTYEKWWCK